MARLAGRLATALAAVAVLGVTGTLTGLWWERTTAITLPRPTGPFAVGRTIDHWVDDTAPEPMAPTPGARRELMAWIWYPAAAGTPDATDDYVPAQMRAAAGPAAGPMKYVTRDASMVHTNALRSPEVSLHEAPFPVVIMRGGASANVANYSTLAEDLASHGYVVVGFDAPYRSNVVVFPDGRVTRRWPANNPELCAEKPQAEQDGCMSQILAAWTSDIGFALDQLAVDAKFAGRLDLTRVGVFGHSLGGATAAQFCHDDPRCTAGIDIDGQPFGTVVQTGLHQPFMFLMSDHSAETDPVSRQILANIQSIYDRLPAGGRLRLAIRGANHLTFSDDGALLKSALVRWVLRRAGVLGIDGARQLEVTAYCIRSFFDVQLKGGAPRAWMSSPQYPELLVLD